MPAVEAGQGIHQVAEIQGEQPVPVSAVKPQAAPNASTAPSRPVEQSQPKRANPVWIRSIIASGRQGIGAVCKASSATGGPAPSPMSCRRS